MTNLLGPYRKVDFFAANPWARYPGGMSGAGCKTLAECDRRLAALIALRLDGVDFGRVIEDVWDTHVKIRKKLVMRGRRG